MKQSPFKSRRLLFMAAASLALALAGCSGGAGGSGGLAGGGSNPGGSSGPAGPALYVADQPDSQLLGYARSANGTLTALTPATTSLALQPTDIAATPSGFLYALTGGAITPFQITANDSLTALSTVSPSSGGEGSRLVLTPDDKTLYVVHPFINDISRFGIGTDGTLSPLQPLSIPSGSFGDDIAFTPDGKFAYVTDTGGEIAEYGVAADGTLTLARAPTLHVSAPGPTLLLTVTPDSKYLYIDNDAGGFWAYSIGTNGELTPFSLATGVTPGGPLALTPSGQFAYAGGVGIQQFRVNGDGTLTALSPALVTTSGLVSAIALSPDGQYAYVTTSSPNALLQYHVGSDGTLTPLSPASVTSGPTLLAPTVVGGTT